MEKMWYFSKCDVNLDGSSIRSPIRYQLVYSRHQHLLKYIIIYNYRRGVINQIDSSRLSSSNHLLICLSFNCPATSMHKLTEELYGLIPMLEPKPHCIRNVSKCSATLTTPSQPVKPFKTRSDKLHGKRG